MPDLHMRIVGARLYEAGRSPYFYTWDGVEDFRFYDPNVNLVYNLNGVTITPAMLWILQPLSRLSYCNITLTWWVLEEVFLFATLVFTCLMPSTFRKQIITITIAGVFFLYSRNWWFHVYNGQYYVFFAFVYSLTGFLYIKRNNVNFPLLVLPVIALVRPYLIVAAFPFFLKDFKKKILPFGIACIATLFISYMTGSKENYRDYFRAMKIYNMDNVRDSSDNIVTHYNTDSITRETCYGKMSNFNPVRATGAGALSSIQHYLNLFKIKWSNPWIFAGILLSGMAIMMLLSRLFSMSLTKENLFLFSFLIYIWCELCTPAYRNPYNMVQYLGVIGVFINKSNVLLITIVIISLLINHDIPIRIDYQREGGEAMILLAMFISLLYRKGTTITPIEKTAN